MLGGSFSYSSSSSTSSSSQTGSDGCYYTEQIERTCRTGTDGNRQCPGKDLEERRGDGVEASWAPVREDDRSSTWSAWSESPVGIFSRFSPFGGAKGFDQTPEHAPYTEREEALPSDSSNFENRYYRQATY
eukprot:750008-Hanusia_phi.AAC.1